MRRSFFIGFAFTVNQEICQVDVVFFSHYTFAVSRLDHRLVLILPPGNRTVSWM
jgi:hypothetical protein